MCLQSIPLCVCSAVPDRKLVIGRERMRRTRPSLPWSPLFVGGQRACGVLCGGEGIADSMRKWRSWEGGGWLGGGGGGSHALLVGTQLLLQPAPASTKFPFLERDSRIVTSINQSQALFWIYISFLLSVRTEQVCFGEKIVLNQLLVRSPAKSCTGELERKSLEQTFPQHQSALSSELLYSVGLSQIKNIFDLWSKVCICS